MTRAVITVDDALEVLNRAHATDPTVMQALLEHRVPCNQALADDPTIQVGAPIACARGADAGEQPFVVGILGILNGLFGVDDRRWGPIAAYYDDEGQLVRFDHTPPAGTDTPPGRNAGTLGRSGDSA